MSTSRSLALSAVAAAVIAIVLVSGVVAIGVLNTTRTTTTIIPISSITTSIAQSNGSPTSSSTSTEYSYSSAPSSPGPSGALAVLMTDPPTVPVGVSDVYVTFENLGIHLSSAGNSTGWHILNVKGQIDLMSVINSTQTVASANITSGDFNALAFNVTSAEVTYDGSNYTADLIYKDHALFVPIIGGINVTNGETSAALIDVSPTVLLLGNTTSPTFAFVPAAAAYTVPAQSVNSLHLKTGDRDDIKNASWWATVQRESKFEVTGVSLTPDSLSFNVTNTGNYPVMLRFADIASRTSASGGNIPLSNFQTVLMQTEVFVTERNGSMIPILEVGNGIVESMIDTAGYLLPVGHMVMFSFSGNVTLGVAISSVYKHAPTHAVVSGQEYVLSLSGNGLFVQTSIQAGS